MSGRIVCVAAGAALALIAAPLGGQAPILLGQAPATPPAVEMQHMKGAMKFEAPLDGFLTPLNGKLKLRASEVDFEPGGTLGDHFHAGPGIRMVLVGELTFVDSKTGREQRVRAGEYIYEGGDLSLRVENRNPQLSRMVVFELLPAEWKGSSAVPLSRQADLEQQGAGLRSQLCGGTAAGDAGHRFWDAKNKWLFAGVGTFRALDYASTRNMRARGRDEILLSNDVVDKRPLFVGIEVAGTAASIGLSYVFHRTGHHNLERWVSIVHISVAGFGSARNYGLTTRRAATGAP